MDSTTPGTFLVIEGTDGSGKGTQFQLLADRLRREGYDVALFDFPQYDSESSHFVREYLNGNYGTAAEVGPYTGSLFYALDRYEAASAIRTALDEGKVVLANRFVGSNMAHQGTKFAHAEERRGYFIWLDNLEFQMLKIPRPDTSIVLRVPAEIAQSLVDQKAERGYTDKKRDLHEADLNHLRLSVEVYDDLCQLFPKDFLRLDCTRDGAMLGIDMIERMIWERVSALLPPKPTAKLAAAAKTSAKTTTATNPYIEKTEQGYTITEAGKMFLQEAVTDPTGNVYAFTDTLSTTTIAAAMARLSRRADDMRVTILDEFATAAGKDESLLKRVISAYGDDSVQQLAGIHFVVENASILLTKKLEWGRLAAYLEQSTRYIYYDQRNPDGSYKYYTPTDLDPATTKLYRQAMDELFATYSKIVRSLTEYVRSHSSTPEAERDGAWMSATRAQACDAARGALPLATTSTVGIYASGQALENLIMHLQSDDMDEARLTGDRLLVQARKVLPTFLERADKPDRGGATLAYRANTASAVSELSQKLLGTRHASETPAIQLTDYWPKNELDIVADMLYESSSLPLRDIRAAVQTMPYATKATVLETYMGERLNRRHRPGRALEKIHYSWDILCEYGVFKDLMRHRMVDNLVWQTPTPRYGYDVPELIEQADLADAYQTCFDISLELFSRLQAEGYEHHAPYAVLHGHRIRWTITYNAREAFHLHELRTSPQGHPNYRKLVQQMHERLGEVHPLLAEQMKFVNQGEDPELSRLAAERYTQFKLQQSETPPDTKAIQQFTNES